MQKWQKTIVYQNGVSGASLLSALSLSGRMVELAWSREP